MAQITLGKDIPNLKITLANDDKPTEILEEGEIRDDEECSDPFLNLMIEGMTRKVPTCLKEQEKQHPPPLGWKRQYPPPLKLIPLRVPDVLPLPPPIPLIQHPVVHGEFNNPIGDIPRKLEERAARFRVENCSQRTVSQTEIKDLYESLGIRNESNVASSWKSNNTLLDTIHVHGVNEMNTYAVFDYFKDYEPYGVERIDDYSCNVTWLDDVGAARALLGLSTVLKNQNVLQATPQTIKAPSETEADQVEDMVIDTKNEVPEMDEVVFVSDMSSDDDDEDKLVAFKHQKSDPKIDDQMDTKPCEKESLNEDQYNLPDIPIPPGLWRLGTPCPWAKAILLRFAVKGMKGVISSTKKRKITAMKNKVGIEHLSKASGSSEAEMKFGDESPNPKKRNMVRMRMYADDEEERLERAAKLKQNISIHNRLGNRELRSDRGNFEVTRWQRGRNEDYRERNENHNVRNDHYAGNDREEETYSVRSAISKPDSNQKVSSRYNVWTDLAESMADDCSGEDSAGKNNRRREWWNNTKFSPASLDLRNKLHSSFSMPKPRASSSQGIDLRSKLDKIRKNVNVSKHRSPLLIGSEKSN